MNRQEEYLKHLDIPYSYHLAKRMEQHRTNPVLGYRTAGSEAEINTGKMLEREMRKLGFSRVWRDPVTVDSWEFRRAILFITDRRGKSRSIQLGAYQTELVTDGAEELSLVYAGKGTSQDYRNLDVRGKLVLVEINQRDEWWINYPVYQAHLKGARAVIAVQTGGYGEVDDDSLNAQDIAGPSEAAAFSISRQDAGELKELLEKYGEIRVFLDADTRVKKNAITYNVIGEITGRNPERKIMLSAHYDSYFDGFQDDNTAVSMMLGIGRSLMASGYKPENTILFCAMAAEEWGVVDSQFDWSTGAYEQVFTAHPEWSGQVIADLNFELPALSNGTRARIRSTHEYAEFLESFLEELPELTAAYPEDPQITFPIETWSDDFTFSIAGIPSMVNDFTSGSFMETNYHSQFDNDSYFDEDVYRLHHELFGLLLLELDRTVTVPLNFAPLFESLREALDSELCLELGADAEGFVTELTEAEAAASELYEHLQELNKARARTEETVKLEKTLLNLFRDEQDTFVRIDWYGNVVFPHVTLQESLELLNGAAESLAEDNLSIALRKIYEIDNNRYAFMFEEEVYRHFTASVLDQPRERLKWGYGRIIGYVSLFGTVQSLLQKKEDNCNDYSEEICFLKDAFNRQKTAYCKLIGDLTDKVRDMKQTLLKCL